MEILDDKRVRQCRMKFQVLSLVLGFGLWNLVYLSINLGQ